MMCRLCPPAAKLALACRRPSMRTTSIHVWIWLSTFVFSVTANECLHGCCLSRWKCFGSPRTGCRSRPFNARLALVLHVALPVSAIALDVMLSSGSGSTLHHRNYLTFCFDEEGLRRKRVLEEGSDVRETWAKCVLRTDVVRHVLRDLMCYAASITRAAACPQRHGATFHGNAPRVPQGLQVNER